MQRGFIQKEKQGLLGEGARQDDALLFAAGDLIHQAIAEMLGADLRKGIASDEDVFFRFESQRAAVWMSSLENKFPGVRGEKQRAFLLDHGNALAARPVRKRVRDEAVQKHTAGKRFQRAGNKLQKRGFAAGIWTHYRNDFTRACLKACRFESKQRRLRWIRGVGIADLLDTQANIGVEISGVS
jgi:hypothetical protein